MTSATSTTPTSHLALFRAGVALTCVFVLVYTQSGRYDNERAARRYANHTRYDTHLRWPDATPVTRLPVNRSPARRLSAHGLRRIRPVTVLNGFYLRAVGPRAPGFIRGIIQRGTPSSERGRAFLVACAGTQAYHRMLRLRTSRCGTPSS